MNKLVERAPTRSLPPVLRWQEPGKPLPVKTVRLPADAQARTLGLEAPGWFPTGEADRPFDFCGHVRRLCADLVRRCADLRHIDVSQLLFGVTQARSSQTHGLQARVTPLRFRNGLLVRRRNETNYQVQRYVVDGKDMLYLVTFCLPRFLDQPFQDKFITLFHELYHISPAFEGDLRRMSGRCAVHSNSKREYDAYMAVLARDYLHSGADKSLCAFLRLDFAQLVYRHGSVEGVVVPRPRLLPLPERNGEE